MRTLFTSPELLNILSDLGLEDASKIYTPDPDKVREEKKHLHNYTPEVQHHFDAMTMDQINKANLENTPIVEFERAASQNAYTSVVADEGVVVCIGAPGATKENTEIRWHANQNKVVVSTMNYKTTPHKIDTVVRSFNAKQYSYLEEGAKMTFAVNTTFTVKNLGKPIEWHAKDGIISIYMPIIDSSEFADGELI